jgi:hypothetical protein
MTIDPKKEEAEGIRSNLEDILSRVDSLPILDSRKENEILGYDEHGMPTN